MLNKIHSNVKSMLIEVREIVSRHDSLSRKGFNANSFDLLLDKPTAHISFKVKAKQKKVVKN